MKTIAIGTMTAILAASAAGTAVAQTATTTAESSTTIMLPVPEPAADGTVKAADVLVYQANPRGAGVSTVTPPNPQAAADPVAPAVPNDPTYIAGPYKGALTAPPAEAMNKVYPVCTRTRQDSCRNPGSF